MIMMATPLKIYMASVLPWWAILFHLFLQWSEWFRPRVYLTCFHPHVVHYRSANCFVPFPIAQLSCVWKLWATWLDWMLIDIPDKKQYTQTQNESSNVTHEELNGWWCFSYSPFFLPSFLLLLSSSSLLCVEGERNKCTIDAECDEVDEEDCCVRSERIKKK